MDNKQPDHADGGPASGRLLVPLVDILGDDNGDDDVAGGHADGADGENRLTADAVDPEDRGDGGEEHDDADDASGEKGGGRVVKAELVEDGGGVVEDGIDARPLLEEHGDGGDDDSLEHGSGLEEFLDGDELELEDVPGSRLTEVGEQLGDGALLKQRLGLDLEEFELDEFVLLVKSSEVGQHLACFLLASVVDQPTGGEGHEDHADEQNHGGEDLKADGREPSGIGLGLDSGAADEVGTATQVSDRAKPLQKQTNKTY